MENFELLAASGSGGVYGLPFADAQWTTERDTKAAQLTFKYPRDCGVRLSEGQIIAFRIDESVVFQGYVFKNKASKDDLISVTAYDQLRYLQNKSTYLFDQKRLDEIVQMLAYDYGLQVGNLSPSSAPLDLVSEDSKLVDIIEEARGLTMDQEGKIYQVWDDKGKISMARLPHDRMTNLMIGDYSLLMNYDYTRSIDDDTYNRVILVKKDEETGEFLIVKAVDDGNIANWGVLQHFETVDEKMTEAEMQTKANAILEVRNRVKRELTLDSIGALEAEAGCSIYVAVEAEGLDGWAMINKAVHKFEGKGAHTMKLTMNMIG